MKIKQVPLFLAPMAGVTDLAYRILAKECGADYTITEFTAASGLSRNDAKSWLKVENDEREMPFIPQIFGGIIEEMVTTIKLLQDRADEIDINFGCPAPKVCRNDAGAALLRYPDRIEEMVKSCLAVANVPITVKMRLGTGAGPNTALEIAKRLEKIGVRRICIHGRTLRQRYSGFSDWNQIKEIVNSVTIPVIANGDVIDSKTAESCLGVTGADGLMIGRGAIGNPTIFYKIKRDLDWSTNLAPWGEVGELEARLWCWKRYLELSNEIYGTRHNKNLKRHAISFTKGLSGASSMRVKLHSIKEMKDLGNSVTEFLKQFTENVVISVS